MKLQRQLFPMLEATSYSKTRHFIIFLLLFFSFQLLGGFFTVFFSHMDGFIGDVLTMTTMFIFIIPGVFLFARNFEGRSLTSLGLSKNHALRDLFLGAFFSIILCMMIMMLQVLMTQGRFLGITNDSYILKNIMLSSVLWIVIAFALGLALRGWMFPAIYHRHNLILALIVPTILFSILHADMIGFNLIVLINSLLLGLLLLFMVLYHDSLWFSIAFHFGWLFSQANLLGIKVGVDDEYSIGTFEATKTLLSSGTDRIETSLLCTIVLLILLVFYGVLIKRKNERPIESNRELSQ